MTRASLVALIVSTPLLMAVAPIHGDIIITGERDTHQSPQLCHIRLGMSLAEPAVGAVILKSSREFRRGGLERKRPPFADDTWAVGLA